MLGIPDRPVLEDIHEDAPKTALGKRAIMP
jgi:hypothetical protein